MARSIDPNRRSEILRAARAVFQEVGYAEARMAEIAKRAGIAAGTLYLYFPSKEALAQALGDDYINRLAESVMPHLAEPDAAQAIADSVHVALSFSAEERDQLRFLGLTLGLGTGFERTPGQMQLHQMIAQALRERMERGENIDYDPQVLAELVGGLLEWVSQQIMINGESELARYETTLIRMLQNALLPTGEQQKVEPRNSVVEA